jgi:hypothetical protein
MLSAGARAASAGLLGREQSKRVTEQRLEAGLDAPRAELCDGAPRFRPQKPHPDQSSEGLVEAVELGSARVLPPACCSWTRNSLLSFFAAKEPAVMRH